jgi:hypothetical protein
MKAGQLLQHVCLSLGHGYSICGTPAHATYNPHPVVAAIPEVGLLDLSHLAPLRRHRPVYHGIHLPPFPRGFRSVLGVGAGWCHTSFVTPPSVAPCQPSAACEVPPGASLSERHTDPSFNAWLQSLPEDDWNGAVDESAFDDVQWVDGVGFVRRGE